MKENNIEKDIKILEKFKNNEMQRDKLERDVRCGGWKIGDIYKCLELDNAIDNILSDYKRVLKENAELNEKILSNAGIYQLGFKDGKESYIQKVKAKIEKDIETNEHTILGRRNGKTLEYGRRLGRIEMCKELLESEE